LKQRIAKFGAFLLFITSLFLIYGTCGSLEIDYITMRQAIIRFAIGLAALGYDAWLINHLEKEAS